MRGEGERGEERQPVEGREGSPEEAGPTDAGPKEAQEDPPERPPGEERVGVEEKPEPPPEGEGKPGLPLFHFRVISSPEDAVPPKLKKVEASPQKVAAGEIVRVRLTPDTDLSGVVAAQVTLSGPKNKHSLYLMTGYNPATGLFEGVARLSPFAASGAWKFSRISLTDGAGNPSIYLEDRAPLKGVTFEVQNSKPDLKAPSLQSFQLLDKQGKPGEKISFQLEASDDLSGIRQVSVSAVPAKGSGYVTGSGYYHPLLKKYRGTLQLPGDAVDGTWHISRVSLSDGAGNMGGANRSEKILAQQTFQVSGAPPSSDTTPPVFEGLRLNPLSVKAGEVVRFWALAYDQESGIASVRIVLADPKGASRLYVDLRFNAANKLWEGATTIPAFSLDGIWSIKTVTLRDVAENQLEVEGGKLQQIKVLPPERLSQHQPYLIFRVLPAKGAQDHQPPQISGINLAPGKAKRGEAVRVYAALNDPGGSGINSASCTFTGPVPQTVRQAILSYNSDTGFYEGNLSFQKEDPPGRWWLSGCYLTDNADNARPVPGWVLQKLKPLDISRATSKAATQPFVVQLQASGTPPADKQAPTLKGFHLAPGKVQAGEALRMYVRAEDGSGSGVAGGNCSFQGPSRALSVRLQWNVATGLWEGNLSVPSSTPDSEWLIKECQLHDRAGNSPSFSAVSLASLPALDLSKITSQAAADHRRFEVQGLPLPSDVKAPRFKAIAFRPNTTQPGGGVRLYVKATDNQQLKGGFCALKPPLASTRHTSYGAAHLTLNPATQLLEATFALSLQAEAGLWSLSSCQLEDQAGNVTKVPPSQMKDAPSADLSVVPSKSLPKRLVLQVSGSKPVQDKSEPLCQKVTLSPTTQKAGLSARVMVQASDKDSGVRQVNVTLQGPDSSRLRQQLSFNPATQQWEGSFLVPLYGQDGLWTVQEVEIEDKAFQRLTLQASHALLKGVSLKVTDSQTRPEQNPPQLTSLKRGKGVVLAGERVRLRAQIKDDQAGVLAASVSFQDATSGVGASVNLEFNPATDLWEGELLVPASAPNGTWQATTATTRDRLGNAVSLTAKDKLLKNLFFTVKAQPTPADSTPPKIHNLTLLPASIQAGQTVRVIAQITDDRSGVGRVSLSLQSPKGKGLASANLLLNPDTLHYEANLSIPLHAEDGPWRVSRIELIDRQGNQRILTSKDPFLQ